MELTMELIKITKKEYTYNSGKDRYKVKIADGNKQFHAIIDENLYRAIKMMQRDHIRLSKDLAKCEKIKDVQISKLKIISDILYPMEMELKHLKSKILAL